MIRVSFSFSFFFLFFLLLLFYVIINFCENHFFFFHENLDYFSGAGIFRNVPACSGMFIVPGFIDAPSETKMQTAHSDL